MTAHDDFYVGYQPHMPSALARHVRAVVLVGLLAMAGLGVVLAWAQRGYAPALFEFGTLRTLRGVVAERPYPHLVVAHPGAALGTGPSDDRASRYLLVAEGKAGADAQVAGLHGRLVDLTGTLVHREGEVLVEVAPDGIVPVDGAALATAAPSPGEPGPPTTVTLRGEIVDSKCFLGVMNPGRLKPHRACATRCLSGGIPPILLVRGEGGPRHLLLVDSEGAAVNPHILDKVAEPLEITGQLRRLGTLEILYADPSTYLRLEPQPQ